MPRLPASDLVDRNQSPAARCTTPKPRHTGMCARSLWRGKAARSLDRISAASPRPALHRSACLHAPEARRQPHTNHPGSPGRQSVAPPSHSASHSRTPRIMIPLAANTTAGRRFHHRPLPPPPHPCPQTMPVILIRQSTILMADHRPEALSPKERQTASQGSLQPCQTLYLNPQTYQPPSSKAPYGVQPMLSNVQRLAPPLLSGRASAFAQMRGTQIAS